MKSLAAGVLVFVAALSAAPAGQAPVPGFIDPRPSAGRRILIDASRDGGGWWHPQQDRLDTASEYQGKRFADYLRGRPIPVDQLARGAEVSKSLLEGYTIAIRAGGLGQYSPGELTAYREFVADGGRLLLLSTILRPAQEDQLAMAFGVRLGGVTEGELRVGRFDPRQPVTQKVKTIDGFIGSGFLDWPTDFTILGFASERTFLDLNGNRRRDSGEPYAAGVWGMMPFGKGIVMVMSNLRTLEMVPQPLTDNILALLTR